MFESCVARDAVSLVKSMLSDDQYSTCLVQLAKARNEGLLYGHPCDFLYTMPRTTQNAVNKEGSDLMSGEDSEGLSGDPENSPEKQGVLLKLIWQLLQTDPIRQYITLGRTPAPTACT